MSFFFLIQLRPPKLIVIWNMDAIYFVNTRTNPNICSYGICVWLERIVLVIVLENCHPILLLRRVSPIGATCCRNKCILRAPNPSMREWFFFPYFWNFLQGCLAWEVDHARRLGGLRFRHNRSNLHKQLPSTLAQRPAG